MIDLIVPRLEMKADARDGCSITSRAARDPTRPRPREPQ